MACTFFKFLGLFFKVVGDCNQLIMLLFEPSFLKVEHFVAVHTHVVCLNANNQRNPNKKDDNGAGYEKHVLHGVFRERFVNHGVHLHKATIFFCHLIELHTKHTHGRCIDYGRCEFGDALIGGVLQNLQGYLNGFIATCRVYKSGKKLTILHIIQSPIRHIQAIYPNHLNVMKITFLCQVIHAHTCTIIGGYNNIRHNACIKQRVELGFKV